MMSYQFIFDLDGTITKKDMLPEIAKQNGREDKIIASIKKTAEGNLPFCEGFSERIQLLKDVPISRCHEIIHNVPLHEGIVSFIRENRDRCVVLTGNLDVWVAPLLNSLGAEWYSSKASLMNGEVNALAFIMDKGSHVRDIAYPYVAVGNGNNDIEMLRKADVGIAFGNVRNPSSAILSVATHLIYEEKTLCKMLKQLL